MLPPASPAPAWVPTESVPLWVFASLVKLRKVVLAAALGAVGAGLLLLGAVTIFVGIYATWAYQDDQSSAQNLILVPFGLVIGASGWLVAYLAYRVARNDTGSRRTR
jgi:hypothetical protein